MNPLRIALIALFSLLAAPAAAQDLEFIDAGRDPVPIYLPTDYDPEEPLPLIIALHGYSQSDGAIEAYFNLTRQVEPGRFLYCIPEGERNFIGDRYWDATDACCDFFDENPGDSGYLRNLIDLIQSQYAVDAFSIHLIGYSNGGFMAFRMACDHADLVASIVSLAGRSFDDPVICTPAEPVHVLHLSGTADQVIRYNGGCTGIGCYPSAPGTVLDWALYNACGPESRPLGEPFDLDVNVPGEETSARIYDDDCAHNVVSELWTMAGSDHGPRFYDPGMGEGPDDNRLAIRAVDWLLTHRKPGCEADLNGDGIADSDDLFLFLDAFAAGDLDTCDLNGDGACDSEDFFAYLDLFIAC